MTTPDSKYDGCYGPTVTLTRFCPECQSTTTHIRLSQHCIECQNCFEITINYLGSSDDETR